ncbi:MAG: alpha-glucan family phosphorylase [Ignavibacteria bacterium]|nr:alpha-glucan family phosphorylase [Ignavibacteria bacterium]
MINFLGTYQVIPSLPEKLEKLRELAYNIHWSWNQDTLSLFRRLDKELWEETHHNPVRMLGKVSQDRLEEAAADDGFVSHLNRAYNNLQIYLTEQTWYEKNNGKVKNFSVLYFSAEFGLTECLQTYSGGLGVLAGDHLKSASDLGIPLIGMGLLYKEGYFQQYLTSDGWQQERYEINDFENLPMKLVLNSDDKPLMLSVTFPGREVYFQIWKIQIGRNPLYLLDTNVQENNSNDRKITESLYGGNSETRIQQEIILGVGGIRTAQELGIKNVVCHMNEGHSAFLSLERMRALIKNFGLTFHEAMQVGFYSNIFTTHTPVPAGIDVFSIDLVEKYFGKYYREELGISDREFYSLGTIMKDIPPTVFNMAHLAMNTAGFINGVSKLHSIVSRKMWASGFKNIPFNEIPIDFITNGVHTRSHLSKEMEDLFKQYLGESWIHNPANNDIWNSVDRIPDEELWRTHERRRERLVAFARRRLITQVKSRGGSLKELQHASEVLNPNALTIGFARRFATYKRATLIFRDIERLADILNNPDFPVQIIIAGKAHPQDDEGKSFIQEVFQMANEEQFKRKIVFIENYDMNVARYLVEGCDIWLNNPRRPLEASGTSGMKVIANGGLNLSVLDGWWDEGFSPRVGWKIGNGEEYTDLDYQDEVEARQIYNTLEKEIVPSFYQRDEDKLPRKWISMMKSSMKTLTPFFSTSRMVVEYYEKFYESSWKKREALRSKDWALAKEIANWKNHVTNNWHQIKISSVNDTKIKDVFVGKFFNINAEIYLGDLTPDDVDVQIYYGLTDKQSDPGNNSFVIMKPTSKKPNEQKTYKYSGAIPCLESGLHSWTIRVLPSHQLMIHPYELGKVYWAHSI